MDSNHLSPLRKGVVGVQFLFVAFGATVLVPLLVGLDPSTALFTAGIGTLLFHLVTKGKVPIFLGSSFAFIAPIIKATELYGLAGTLSGMVGVAMVYFVMSALVKAGYQVDRAPVSTGSYWSGNYIDRAFTCRDWSEYGKGKLDIGVAFVVYCRDCIYSGEGTIEVNTYFLWNYCGIYCCADLL